MGFRCRARRWACLAVAVLISTAAAAVVEALTIRVAEAQTAGATSVRRFGARGDGKADDTLAFARAQAAALASTLRYPKGPGGRPQAVVYVPPGTYRLLNLEFASNVRMEVDAAAVLAPAGGRHVDTSRAPSLILWDGRPGAALTNVTLIGVNSSAGGIKSRANPVFPGWSVKPDFTFDLDPARTNASVLVTGVQALNVDGFSIQNVFSLQNDSQPSSVPDTDDGWWPQSRKAALGLRGRADTPADGSAFYDPHHGSVVNWYNARGPKGFGPNQVNAGHDISLSHIFTDGGTALRFETDASQGKPFPSEIRGVSADDVAGRDCNRAVAFAPHSQKNYGVHVTRVRAVACAQGVNESIDETSDGLPTGAFVDSTVAGVSVIGADGAQIGVPGANSLWTVGVSDRAFGRDAAPWAVRYKAGTMTCSGTFGSPPDVVMTDLGTQRPVCDAA